jgi:hypothetical protein
MEEIIVQKFNYSNIIPYKDYCKISDKELLMKSQTDYLDIFDEYPTLLKRNDTLGNLTSLPTKKTRRGKIYYFESNEEVNEQFPLVYMLPSFNWVTTKDSQIKRHYGRPFTDISVYLFERSIRRHGNKVTIKLYQNTKSRNFNCIHFKKNYYVFSVTFNLDTGNFTVTEITKNGKIKTKRFRTNSFTYLVLVLKKIFNVNETIDTKIRSSSREVLDNTLFLEKIKEIFGGDSIPLTFLEFFINKKQIKVPDNNWMELIVKNYPTEKFLKKNGRKLIASILDMYGIKSKFTIKLLHKYPNINLYNLVKICKYFGNDYTKYIAGIDERVFGVISSDMPTNKFIIIDISPSLYELSNIEKENLVRIFNSSIKSRSFTIKDIDDHLSMINTIRNYDENISIRSKSYEEFSQEHIELSKIISSINKGWVVEYQFDEITINKIQKPLECLMDDFTLHTLYPVILKREEDYIEEGKVMHHCVASYANKDTSIIISVRTEDMSERVTCEFDIQSGRCLQKRSFCNALPPKHFENGLEILEGIVIEMARWGILNWKEKKKVPIMINGKEIQKNRIPVNAVDIFNVQLPL